MNNEHRLKEKKSKFFNNSKSLFMKNCQKMYKALISYKIYINITLSTNIKFQFDVYINSICQEKQIQ